MQQDQTKSDRSPEFEPIVAVFDTKTMALRAVDALAEADFDDLWFAVVRGESGDGETLVAHEGNDEILLRQALTQRGSSEEHARRFDGILPPGTAVISLRVHSKFDHAIDVIQLVGGHVEHF